MGRLSRALRRTSDRPAMFALSFLLVGSSIITLSKLGLTADALSGLLPEWAFVVFAAAYGLAGLFIIAGLALDRLNLEAAGCALAAGGVAARIIATIAVLSLSVPVIANTAILAVLGMAFVVRFRQCLEGEHIIRMSPHIAFEEWNDEDEWEDSNGPQ
jgi:hypothetical protein